VSLDWGGSVSCRVLAGGMLACRVRARASKFGLRALECCREGLESLAGLVVAHLRLGEGDSSVYVVEHDLLGLVGLLDRHSTLPRLSCHASPLHAGFKPLQCLDLDRSGACEGGACT
jgi:hypothetical protein